MKKSFKKSPWSWIPTLYFAEGIPYVAVMSVSGMLYKRLGVSNADITLYTTLLMWPWVLKFFWSPFVDLFKTKRWWIVTMQLFVGIGLAGVAFMIPMPFFFQATLAFFWCLAFSSATHDIAADGFYMLALNQSDQSLYVGIRSTFYRIATVTGSGLLVILAGFLESSTGLNPVEFTVTTSSNAVTTTQLPSFSDSNAATNSDFVVTAEMLAMKPGWISSDSAKKIINAATDANIANGFVQKETVKTKTPSWWTQRVSTPFGNWISKNFGQKKAKILTRQGEEGNVGIVGIRLSHQPAEGKNIVLNTAFKDGDKNFLLLKGDRLVFSSTNWNKMAYMVVRVDPKLTGQSSATFKGLSGNIPLAWSIAFFVLAGLFVAVSIYHRWVLAKPVSDKPVGDAKSGKAILREFLKTFETFFKKKGVWVGIFFLLTYRMTEAMLVRIVPLFFLDNREVGGIGLTTSAVGLTYGTVGVIALLCGGILGGFMASKRGLKFWLWPMALCIALPPIPYVFLSLFQPESYLLINIAVAIEQFCYGFGFTAYMLYMIYLADGEHKTAHYAMCTVFMALSMLLPGLFAGWLQEHLGYEHYFIFAAFCMILCFIAVSLLKIDPKFGVKKKENVTT